MCGKSISRSLLCMNRSYVAHTASTVTPSSLLSNAATENTAVHSNHTHFHITTPPVDTRSRHWQYFRYDRNDRRKNRHAKISARPTIPATASVWIGCDANSSPAAIATDTRPVRTPAVCVNSPVTSECSNTFPTW